MCAALNNRAATLSPMIDTTFMEIPTRKKYIANIFNLSSCTSDFETALHCTIALLSLSHTVSSNDWLRASKQ